MTTSQEVNDAPAAPVDSAPQNLVGDSLTNQSDSDLARTAAFGASNDAMALFDPKGNEFQIDGLEQDQEQNVFNQEASMGSNPLEGEKKLRPQQGDAATGEGVIRPEGALASNLDGGLTKSVTTKDHESEISLAADGRVQSFSITDKDGNVTKTNYDDTGRATSRTITKPNGESSEVGLLSSTRVDSITNPDGSRSIAFSERGRMDKFDLDSSGRIREATRTRGFNVESREFDKNGNVESLFTKDTRDGITTSTFTREGFRETSVHNENTNETDVHRVSQLDPTRRFNRLDTSGERTDNIHVNPDGSSDSTTTFKNEQGVTYKTRTGSDGRYQTDKVDDSTGETWRYRHGVNTGRA